MAATDQTSIEYVPSIGRRARTDCVGDAEDLDVPRGARGDRRRRAGTTPRELGDYFVDEAKVCFALYRQWIPDLKGFLRENGVDQDELDRRATTDIARATPARRTALEPRRALGPLPTAIEAHGARDHREQADEALRAASTRPRRSGASATTATSTTPTG